MADLAVIWPAFDEDDDDFAEWNDAAASHPAGPGSVTFPTTDLAIRAYIALGADLTASWLTWQWEDITGKVRFSDGIVTQSGRLDEASQLPPGSTRLRLDNRDGRFSRRNPLGQYYGLLSKNTPLWIQVDAGSGFKTVVQHYVNEWPTRWTDKSANDSTVPITASGVLRRLQQGEVLRSALRRYVLAQSPVAFWPLDDPSGSSSAQSIVDGQPALTVGGVVEFAAVSSLAAGTASPDTTLGSLTGSLAGASASGWWAQFGFLPPPNATASVARIYTNGALTNVVRFFLPVAAGDSISVFIDDDGGAGPLIGLAGTAPTGWEGTWHAVGVGLTQSGSNIVSQLVVDGVVVATDTTAGTLGSPTRVLLNQNFTATACPSFTGLAIGDGAIPTGYYDALTAYVGEQAHNRVARLCAEEGVAFAATSSRSAAMGPQPLASLLTLLRECEAADLGSLYEIDFGLGYQAPSERYNAPARFELDFALGQLAETPEPADDDQRTRNRWTASRTAGGEATVDDADSIAADGLYEDAATINVESDTQLGNNAGWHVHLGTVDEDRWPLIEVNLAHSPELIDDWCALPFGGRVLIANPLVQVNQDDIDAVAEGRFQRITSKMWTGGLNTTPYRPYEVQIVGETSTNQGRIDSANSTLVAAVLAADTSLSVASPGAVWVTGAVNFDLEIGGERMTVTNISGATSPQTFTVTRAVNGVVKDQRAATKVRLWRPGVIAL